MELAAQLMEIAPEIVESLRPDVAPGRKEAAALRLARARSAWKEALAARELREPQEPKESR
jgi:hypothetical protein